MLYLIDMVSFLLVPFNNFQETREKRLPINKRNNKMSMNDNIGPYMQLKYKLRNDDSSAQAMRPLRRRRTTKKQNVYLLSDDSQRVEVSLYCSLLNF